MSVKRGARRSRSQQALELFEKGLRALYRREHARARDAFNGLLADFPDEVEIAERARTYLQVCERALASPR